MRNLPPTSANPPSLLRKLTAAVATVAVIGLALMLSVVVIAVILVVGTIAWSYLWWRTRDLRKQMRTYPFSGVTMEDEMVEGNAIRGEVIEGEVIRVANTQEMK